MRRAQIRIAGLGRRASGPAEPAVTGDSGAEEPVWTPEVRRRRRRLVWVVAVLLLLGLVLPHVGLSDEAGFGRWLLPAGFFFLHVQSENFAPPVDQAALAFGFNVTYLGLALQELGLLFAVPTFWSLYGEEINRWLHRLLTIGAWMLTLGVPFVLAGRVLIGRAGVPAELGWAWLPVLASGVLLVVAARRARRRIDRTWYLARPELT